MADTWTTPSDRADGYVVGQTVWNQLLGATGDLMYLYNGGGGTRKYKTATQVLTTTTTYADVTASSGSFAFAIAASEVWYVQFWIPLAFGGTGGAKFQITGPAAPTNVDITGYATRADNNLLSHGTDPRFTAVTAFSSDIAAGNSATYAAGSASTYPNDHPAGVFIRAKIANGANAGTITLQVAQNSSNSTTTLGIGSFMKAERLA